MKIPDHRKITVFLVAFAFNFISCGNNLFADTYKEMKKLETDEKQVAQQEIILRPEVKYKAGDFKDPFRGYAKVIETKAPKESIALPAFTIQGVVWGGEKPQAIVNNKVVRIGDTIENMHIVDINKNGIDVFFEGRQFSLAAPASGSLGQVKPIPEGEEK